MPGTATAAHAQTLFSLTMESRYGCQWRSATPVEVIVHLAEEIIQGFGGQPVAATPGCWNFPDGSCAHVGAFGLRGEVAATGGQGAEGKRQAA